jgi:hypothetical protein
MIMATDSTWQHIALVADSTAVQLDELIRVSAALQKQASRDFGPIWGIDATVDAFVSLEDVPIDYWPMIVRDDIRVPGAAGIHQDKDGQPFALVQYSDGWSLTASHELLEMLCDPSGNRVIAGNSPMPGQARVNFLVEVCDPSEAIQFAYSVNGTMVSDFYTPHFFDPVAASGVRYSFTGALDGPRQVRQGGYISWHDPVSDEWFQQVFFGNKPEFRSLGRISQQQGSIRSEIYKRTPEARGSRKPSPALVLTTAVTQATALAASVAKSSRMRVQIARILHQE